MSRGGVIVIAATVVAGCAFKSGNYGDAGLADAPADAADAPPPDVANIDPCTLPALSLRVATLAGCADPGTADGPRGTARFSDPVNVALSSSGIAYVADYDSSLLRKIDLSGNTTTLVSRPDFTHPFGLTFSADGYLFAETDDDDLGQHSLTTGTIWKVNPATGAATVVARDLGRPRGLALLPDGRIAIADHQHHVVELFDPGTGTMTLLAGMLDTPGHLNANGAAAQFAQPYDVVVLDGDLIVSDLDNHLLRRVTLLGDVTDFAGTGVAGHADDTLAAAMFGKPQGLAIDANDTIYVTEIDNHDVRIVASGMVTTLAGSVAGWHDDDDASQAMFYGVEGLDVSADGHRLVVADGNIGDGMAYNHVRVIHR